MSTIQGQFENGSLIPVSNVTWADLANSPYGSWDQWRAFDGGVPKDITITTNSLDFGRVDNINVELEIEATGSVTTSIQHSDDNTSFTTATVSDSVVQGFSARFVRALNPALSSIFPNTSKPSPIALLTPFFEEYEVAGGQFTESQSRTLVMIFANLIAFENVLLGNGNPPPVILFNCPNILPRFESKMLLI